MSKFKMKLKLTGFELEIEGTREDIPLIAQNVGQQIAGLLMPAAGIVMGEDTSQPIHVPHATQTITDISSIKRKRRKSNSSSSSNLSEVEKQATVINWRHDPSKWSSPNQTWSTLNKAIWLMYVVEQESQLSELTIRQIADTFNAHFKQAKTIQTANITRDLGNKKAGKEALVGENTTASPAKWYLTEAGKKLAIKLISDVKG